MTLPARQLADLVWYFAHEISHLHPYAYGDRAPLMIEEFAKTMASEVLVGLGLWNDAALERS